MNEPPPIPQDGRIKVFIASPGDVSQEREVVFRILDMLKHIYALEIYRWEDTVPEIGHPQHSIDKQIPSSECDIFVAILWSRLGTPTGQYRPDGSPYLSGTQFEIEKAIEAHERQQSGLPKIMIYRKIDDPCDTIKSDDAKIIQYGKLLEYLKRFEPLGEHPAWIYPFHGNDFEKIFSEHITRVLGELKNHKVPAPIPTASNNADWAKRVGLTQLRLDAEIAVQGTHLRREELRAQIEFWLISISEDKRAPYRSVGQLCDSGDELSNRIDDEIVELAQSDPRRAQWLIERLFQVHCEEPTPPRLIRATSWQRVRFEWEALFRREAFSSAPADFRIAGKKIYFGERILVLTTHNHNLLRRLLEIRGDLCTYADLIAVGWPEDDPSGVNLKTLQEAMRRLRGELKGKYTIDADWWIETIYSQGYRLRLADESKDQNAGEQKGRRHVH